MRKFLFFVALLFSTITLANQSFTFPPFIICSQSDRCYAGRPLTDHLEIGKQESYPYFFPDGKYIFDSAYAQIDKVDKKSPGIISINYINEDFPQIGFHVVSNVGMYGVVLNNKKGWDQGPQHLSTAICISRDSKAEDCPFEYK
jgi:hypothetical protein